MTLPSLSSYMPVTVAFITGYFGEKHARLAIERYKSVKTIDVEVAVNAAAAAISLCAFACLFGMCYSSNDSKQCLNQLAPSVSTGFAGGVAFSFLFHEFYPRG